VIYGWWEFKILTMKDGVGYKYDKIAGARASLGLDLPCSYGS